MGGDRAERGSGDEDRVSELLRINAELAAEVRSLSRGRREAPSASQLAGARRVGKLNAERDALEVERDALATERDALRESLRVREAERDALQRHRDELQREVTRLRSGVRGLLRRTRARLLRS